MPQPRALRCRGIVVGRSQSPIECLLVNFCCSWEDMVLKGRPQPRCGSWSWTSQTDVPRPISDSSLQRATIPCPPPPPREHGQNDAPPRDFPKSQNLTQALPSVAVTRAVFARAEEDTNGDYESSGDSPISTSEGQKGVEVGGSITPNILEIPSSRFKPHKTLIVMDHQTKEVPNGI